MYDRWNEVVCIVNLKKNGLTSKISRMELQCLHATEVKHYLLLK